MNRPEFQALAEVRIKEAKALLDAQLWDGAYYLAGYAVECALKACIAKMTRANDFPPRESKDYTHDVNVLLKTAKLEGARTAEGSANPTFEAYWRSVVKWKEDTRYKRVTQSDAENFYAAITDPTNGVLRWVQLHW